MIDVRARAEAMTEKELQQAIVECAALYGYSLVYHTWLSARSTAGFPDLVLLKAPRVVIIECKAERGEVSPAQQAWLDEWAACGATTGVIRPSDWYAGRVEKMLR